MERCNFHDTNSRSNWRSSRFAQQQFFFFFRSNLTCYIFSQLSRCWMKTIQFAVRQLEDVKTRCWAAEEMDQVGWRKARWEKEMHEALIHTIEVYRHRALLYCFSQDFHNFIHRRHFHFSTMLCLQLLSLPEALLIFPFRVSAKRQFSTYEIPPHTISSPVECGIALVRRRGWMLPIMLWCLSFFFSAFFYILFC